MYQCGPCSLRAIKEGDIDLPYDGTFILAEVNSDIITHKKVENGEWDIVGINRSHVGMVDVTLRVNLALYIRFQKTRV